MTFDKRKQLGSEQQDAPIELYSGFWWLSLALVVMAVAVIGVVIWSEI